MKRQLALLLMLALCTASAVAQGPNGSGTYYRNADGQKGKALKTALFNIIKNPSVTTYAGLKDAYKKTDVREDGYLRDWYSNVTKFEPGSAFGNYKKEGDAYNREHTVPQSWFGEASPMKSDIVHVVPVDGYINNMRSDYPFGKVNKSASNTKSSINNYSYCGPSQTPGYTGTVFEPNDDVKGDIARIYFYMATCYEDRITTWTKGTGAKVIADDRETPFLSWVMDLLMEWSALDPVDEVETARNNAVYDVQKNRNPFVDYPGLEEFVWGGRQLLAFSYDDYDSLLSVDSNVVELSQPSRSAVYSLSGQVVEPQSMRPGIYVRQGKKFVVK